MKTKINNLKNLNLLWPFNLLLLISFFHMGHHQYRKTLLQDHWANGNDYNEKFNVLNQKKERLLIFSSFFSNPTFQKYLNYNITPKFHSNFKDELQKENNTNDLKKSWQNTFSKPNSISLNLEKSLTNNIEQFVNGVLPVKIGFELNKILKQKNISNGNYQIDIEFSPETFQEFNYDNEYKKSNLFYWAITKNKQSTENISLVEKVISTQIPDLKNIYSYKGGVISFWYNIEKGDIIGFTRYRRFYQVNFNFLKFDDLKDSDLTISLSNISNPAGGSQFITVDNYEQHNYQFMSSNFTNFEITFGKVLPSEFYKFDYSSIRNEQINRTISSVDQPILTLKGEVKHNEKRYHFETTVEKLIYSYLTGNFHKKTQMNTQLVDSNIDGETLGQIQLKVQNNLLANNSLFFITKLKLNTLGTFLANEN